MTALAEVRTAVAMYRGAPPWLTIVKAQTPEIERRKAAYQKEIFKLKDQITDRSEKALEEASRSLEKFRDSLNAEFNKVEARSVFAEAQLLAMQDVTAAEIKRLETILVNQMGQAVDDMGVLGEQKVIAPLEAARARVGPVATKLAEIQGISPELLKVSKEHSAKLIRVARGGLTGKIQKEIDTILDLGLLGQIEMREAVKQINQALDGPKGVFKYTPDAERIFRTESLRAAGIVEQAGLERVAEVLPVVKIWRWSGVSRVNHARADGQRRKVGEKFKIGKARLLFPVDPQGGPGETINCSCYLETEIDFEALEEAA